MGHDATWYGLARNSIYIYPDRTALSGKPQWLPCLPRSAAHKNEFNMDNGTTAIMNDLPYAIPASVLSCLFQSHFLWTSWEVLRGRRVGDGQKPPRWKQVPVISTAVLLILNLIFTLAFFAPFFATLVDGVSRRYTHPLFIAWEGLALLSNVAVTVSIPPHALYWHF